MKILDANAGLLTNYEVLSSLKDSQMARYNYDVFKKEVRQYRATENKARHLKGKVFFGMSPHEKELWLKSKEAGNDLKKIKSAEHVCWVKDKVISYLSRFSPGQQTDQNVSDFLAAAAPYIAVAKLGQGEILQLINLRPTSLVEIHRVIEECEERLTQDQVEELLKCIQDTLPMPVHVEQDDTDMKDSAKKRREEQGKTEEDAPEEVGGENVEAEEGGDMEFGDEQQQDLIHAPKEAEEPKVAQLEEEQEDEGDDDGDDDGADDSIAGGGGADSGDDFIDDARSGHGRDGDDDGMQDHDDD